MNGFYFVLLLLVILFCFEYTGATNHFEMNALVNVFDDNSPWLLKRPLTPEEAAAKNPGFKLQMYLDKPSKK